MATGGNAVRATHIRLGVSDPDAAMAKARQAAVVQATSNNLSVRVSVVWTFSD